jgi:hypothetical protein
VNIDTTLLELAEQILGLIRQATDESALTVEKQQAFTLARLTEELAPDPLHDLVTELMLLADHKLLAIKGHSQNLHEIANNVEELLKELSS